MFQGLQYPEMKSGSVKRKLSLTVVLLFAFSLSGCYIGADADLRRKEHKLVLNVFEHLKNEDIDFLTELFAERTSDQHDLEEEWEQFFDD